MAKVNIYYGCGCGFRTRDLSEATAHCDASGHLLTISGTISPEVARKAATSTTRRVATVAGSAQPEGFEGLRSKLRGG